MKLNQLVGMINALFQQMSPFNALANDDVQSVSIDPFHDHMVISYKYIDPSALPVDRFPKSGQVRFDINNDSDLFYARILYAVLREYGPAAETLCPTTIDWYEEYQGTFVYTGVAERFESKWESLADISKRMGGRPDPQRSSSPREEMFAGNQAQMGIFGAVAEKRFASSQEYLQMVDSVEPNTPTFYNLTDCVKFYNQEMVEFGLHTPPSFGIQQIRLLEEERDIGFRNGRVVFADSGVFFVVGEMKEQLTGNIQGVKPVGFYQLMVAEDCDVVPVDDHGYLSHHIRSLVGEFAMAGHVPRALLAAIAAWRQGGMSGDEDDFNETFPGVVELTRDMASLIRLPSRKDYKPSGL